jgi:hypothetical protein
MNFITSSLQTISSLFFFSLFLLLIPIFCYLGVVISVKTRSDPAIISPASVLVLIYILCWCLVFYYPKPIIIVLLVLSWLGTIIICLYGIIKYYSQSTTPQTTLMPFLPTNSQPPYYNFNYKY